MATAIADHARQRSVIATLSSAGNQRGGPASSWPRLTATETRKSAAAASGRGNAAAPGAAGDAAAANGNATPSAAPEPPTTGDRVAEPLPPITPVGVHRDANAMLTSPVPMTLAQLTAIAALNGVVAIEVVDVGTVGFQGAPANAMGVDPGTFRNFTPAVTAASDRLWQYLSAGSLASSFDMSRDRNLTLGVEVPVTAAESTTASDQWLGAFMSVGLPGVDVVVGNQLSGSLGLTHEGGVIVSAPSADPFALQTALLATVPHGSVVLMRPGMALGSVPGAGGATVTAAQLSTTLTAAVSRVGKPYVWGATGPNGFDCSGLVGWSFAAAGIYLPRTAAEQTLAGPAIPLNSLQPGDLLFWSFDPSDPGFIDHVAIYVGNGQMIEAPQTGSVVHIIPVWTPHLVGAIRIAPAVAARLGSPWHS